MRCCGQAKFDMDGSPGYPPVQIADHDQNQAAHDIEDDGSMQCQNGIGEKLIKRRSVHSGCLDGRAWTHLFVSARDLALQAIQVLLVGWFDPRCDELLVHHRIERLLPADECLAALTGKRDAENKVMVL